MQRLLNILKSSDSRLNRSYTQMLFSLLIKLSGMLISFFSVPLIIGFTEYSEYGVFLALTSSFALINVMDVGLGDGLRNKFATCKSTGNFTDARMYISTSYFVNFLFSGLIVSLYFLFESYIDWSALLNLPATKLPELRIIGRILIIATAAQFFLQAFLNVLKGDQRYITYSVITFILNLLSVAGILFYMASGVKGSLLTLVIAFFVVPNAALLVISVFYFATRYREVRPSLAFVRPDKLKSLAAIGLKFFVINIMGVVSLQCINVMVINWFSPDAVVDFNLLFRYYFLLISFAFILFNPIWSTFTEAIVTKDVEWLRKLLSKSVRIAVMMILALPVMLLISNRFISTWSNTVYESPLSTNLLFATWTALTILCEPYKMLVKGSGYLNAYAGWSFVFTALQLLIPAVLILEFHWNVDSILYGCVVAQLLFFVFFIRKSRQITRQLEISSDSTQERTV